MYSRIHAFTLAIEKKEMLTHSIERCGIGSLKLFFLSACVVFQKLSIAEDIKIPFGWPLWVLNLVLTLSVTFLHVVESITLPLWIGSYPHQQSSKDLEIEQEVEEFLQRRLAEYSDRITSTNTPAPHHSNVTAVNTQLDRYFSTDPFFVLSVAMFVSTVVYGCSLLSYNMCWAPKKSKSTIRKVRQRL